jgi:hypothetical protein
MAKTIMRYCYYRGILRFSSSTYHLESDESSTFPSSDTPSRFGLAPFHPERCAPSSHETPTQVTTTDVTVKSEFCFSIDVNFASNNSIKKGMDRDNAT